MSTWMVIWASMSKTLYISTVIIANSNEWRTDGLTDWRTDGLTDWRTDGLTDWRTDGRRVQYLSEYELRCKKKNPKNPGNIYQKSAKPVLKLKYRSPLEKLEKPREHFLGNIWYFMVYSITWKWNVVHIYIYIVPIYIIVSLLIWSNLFANQSYEKENKNETSTIILPRINSDINILTQFLTFWDKWILKFVLHYKNKT